MIVRGKCRWCGCREARACVTGCGWANVNETLCTACVNVDREWEHLTLAHLPNMHRAFFLGFLVGSLDPRAHAEGLSAKNPYTPLSAGAKYWRAGHQAGEKEPR